MTYYTNSKEGFDNFLKRINGNFFHVYIDDIYKFIEDFKEHIIDYDEYENTYVFNFQKESDYWFDTLTSKKEDIFEIYNKYILFYL